MSFIAAMIILGTYCSIEESVNNSNWSKPPCAWSKEFTESHGKWAMKGWLIQQEKEKAQMQRQINFYKKLWRGFEFVLKSIVNVLLKPFASKLNHEEIEAEDEIIENTNEED